MTRYWLAFVAATAFAAGAPALAQDGSPPHSAAPPAWSDPQTPGSPGEHATPYGPDHAGAPFAHPFSPGVYPGAPDPYPGEPLPYGDGPGPYRHSAMSWHREGAHGYGYGYQDGAAAAAPCGCSSYSVTWVPVPIETRYRYSAPIRHAEDVVDEQVVNETVVESKAVPARRTTKYVKSAPATRLTKGKAVRSTK